MMGGTIVCESQVGIGTTFTLTFPGLNLVELTSKKLDHTPIDVLSIKFEEASVLIADDNMNNRELLVEVLSELGLRIFQAVNGKEALEIFDKNLIDLIIMDLKMPVMDGFAAIKHIRESMGNIDIPVLAVTASVMSTEQQKIKDAGFNLESD